MGLNLTYTPRPWLQLYLGSSYSFNNSTRAIYDYEAANLGGGLGLRIKF